MRARRPISRPATGVRAPRPRLVRGVREVIREHLPGTGLTVERDLARAWNIRPHSAHRLMNDKNRSITPEHIHAVVRLLKLDEFDAAELHALGAIESGWRIANDYKGKP